nr:MAG TPA: hypothetical protein [Caudoviricetes sp.]
MMLYVKYNILMKTSLVYNMCSHSGALIFLGKRS